VVFDKQGNLYGATETGTVFQLAPPAKKGDAWTETVLYTFKGKNDNNDGMQPSGGLVIDSTGNLYGVTAYGGTGGCILLGILYGCGTVYELSPPQQKGGQWTETILSSFQSGKDGYFPWGNLTFDKSGNLYGATQFGGGKGNTCDPYYQYCGTVFKVSPPKQKGGQWTEQVLHSFAGIVKGQQSGDGSNPAGGLLLDSKGAIYGATSIGGYNCPQYQGAGCGTAFKLTPPAKKRGEWTENILHRFTYGNDGASPNGGLVFDAEGSFYGTAQGGGSRRWGVIFRLKVRNGRWTEEVLYTFTSNTDGTNPTAGLTFDSSGNLYGTALSGAYLRGVLFRLSPEARGGWTFSDVYTFTGAPDAAYPEARLVFDKGGNLYSTTTGGGTGGCQGGCGTVFEVSP
jgi:hypothetical protein